jgi:hypothetical protein
MLFFSATVLLPFALLVRLAWLVVGVLFVLVLRLEDPEIVVETIEPLFPEAAIFLEPFVGLFQGPRVDATRAHLCVARARDQAGAFENLQVLGIATDCNDCNAIKFC